MTNRTWMHYTPCLRGARSARRAASAFAAILLAIGMPLGVHAEPATAPPPDRLVAAAASVPGQSVALRRLLQIGGNPHAADTRGVPAIALAVLAKDAESVQALLDADPALASATYTDAGNVGRTVLITSVFMREPAVTAALIKAGADVRATDSTEVSALLAAAYTGNVETARLLLDGGADPNQRDHNGTSPLALASASGNVGVVRLLFEHKAWPYPLDAWGKNAVANARGQIKDPAIAREMVALLTEHHAPLTNTNRAVDAEYLEAVHRGDLPGVKAAIAKGADVNARRILTLDNGLCEALSLAVPNVAVMSYLLDHGVDLHARSQAGFTALHMASGRSGTPQSVELLVQRGLDVNEKSNGGVTALYAAVNEDVPATVELLLKLGANASVAGPGGTNMLDLARYGKRSPRIAAALERAGAEPGGPGTPEPCAVTAIPIPPCAMFAAAESGNPDRIRHGLEAGLDPNMRDAAGRSLIEVALVIPVPGTNMGAPAPDSDLDTHRIAWKKEIVRLLLDHGADGTRADRGGVTALHRVAGDPRLAELAGPLLAKGAPVNAVAGEKLVTPLLLAISKGNLSVVTELLAAGADPNLPMAQGVTPLMFASLQPAPYVSALLGRGAKVDVAAETGVTPLKAAISAGHADVVELLLKAGANPDYDGGRPPSPRAMSAGKGAAIKSLFPGPPAAR